MAVQYGQGTEGIRELWTTLQSYLLLGNVKIVPEEIDNVLGTNNILSIVVLSVRGITLCTKLSLQHCSRSVPTISIL